MHRSHINSNDALEYIIAVSYFYFDSIIPQFPLTLYFIAGCFTHFVSMIKAG